MSFFRYPGGKFKLRDAIISRLKQYITSDDVEYREPFFGGGSIGLKLISESQVKKIWINDKDVGIACLWTSAIRYSELLKEKVKEFVPTVQAFHAIKQELLQLEKMPQSDKPEAILDIGFKKLVIHQISYSGLGTKSSGPLGGEGQKSPYKINCRWSPPYICKKLDKLHTVYDGIDMRHGSCTDYDFARIIEDDNGKNRALIYLDPPYFVKGNKLYQCGFTLDDHKRLANVLKTTKHAWVLSYDDCPDVRQLYEWAEIEEIKDVIYNITALTVKKQEQSCTEGDDLPVKKPARLSRKKSELLIYPK